MIEKKYYDDALEEHEFIEPGNLPKHITSLDNAFGVDKGRVVKLVDNRNELFEVLSGLRMPHYPELSHEDFPGAEVGEVVLEGTVSFATFGTRAGLDCDCEYLVTEDGQEFFDNNLFRGLWNKAVSVIKTDYGFEVQLLEELTGS